MRLLLLHRDSSSNLRLDFARSKRCGTNRKNRSQSKIVRLPVTCSLCLGIPSNSKRAGLLAAGARRSSEKPKVPPGERAGLHRSRATKLPVVVVTLCIDVSLSQNKPTNAA